MITSQSVDIQLNILNQKLEGIVLSTKTPAEIPPDSDIALSVWQDDICLGVSGISYGLSGYYGRDFEEMTECKKDPYSTAIKNVNSWILTHMQATSGTTEQRSKFNFRKVLVNSWKDILANLGQSLDYVLPAMLNFWMIPSVQDQLLLNMISIPSKKCLLMNYDYTAKRNKFKYNQGLYVFQRAD